MLLKIHKMQTINSRMENLEAELDRFLNQLQENDNFESVEKQLAGLSEDLGVEAALLEKVASLQTQAEELEKYKQLPGKKSCVCFDNLL